MTLRTKLALACGIALLILGGVSRLSYQWTLRADEDEHWVTHTYMVLEKLDGVAIDTIAVEADQRGYALMGEKSSLTHYSEGLNRQRDELQELSDLTSDNPRQQQSLKQLGLLISRKISELQPAFAKHSRTPAQPAGGPVETQSHTTAEIRAMISTMKAEEYRLLAERSRAAHTTTRGMKIVIVLGNMLAVLFFAAAALAIYQEMGKRSKAEEYLRQSEERFRLMAARIKEYAIFMLDPGGRVMSWNEGAARINGYSAEEIIGQHFSRFYPPDDVLHGKPDSELRIAVEKGQYEEENWRVRKDGSRFWANVVITALRDDRGRLQGFAKVSRDMTERRRTEEETKRQNAQLAAANKELDTFSYSVAHDLRAPLRAIDGFSQALLQDYGEQIPEEGKVYLQRVRAGTVRMAQLIDDLLNLGRISRFEIVRSRLDLSRLAEEVAAQLRSNDDGRQVIFLIASGIFVNGDRNLLRIVLENLLGNAWKFTSKMPSAEIEFGAQNENGERVLFVRDQGPGFDMQYADKLFGVFQRLHRDTEFPGTGVGLATVQRIIHRHGGRIWAEAAVGKGATFYFVL